MVKAVLRIRQEDPIDFVVDDDTAIEKGTICKLSDGRGAFPIQTEDDAVPCAGIARREKIAGDGRTRLAIYRKGIFDIKVASGGTIGLGNQVVISGVDAIAAALTDGTEDHAVLGKALEDGDKGEIIQIAVNL